MFVGAVGFLVMAIAVQRTAEGATEEEPTTLVLTYLAVGYAVMAIVLRGLAPDWLTDLILASARAGQPADERPQASQPDSAFHKRYAARTMICTGLIEGAALLAILAYLMEGHVLGLIVGVVMALVLAAQVPTEDRLNDWIARQREEQLRVGQFGG
jgi:hypothetical protein